MLFSFFIFTNRKKTHTPETSRTLLAPKSAVRMCGWILITSPIQGGQRETALSCAEPKQFFQDDPSVTLTRVCSPLTDCSGVSYTAARVMIIFRNKLWTCCCCYQAPSQEKTKLPPRRTSFWDIPCSCRGFSSAPHHSCTTGSISWDHCHGTRRLGGLWALLQHDDLEGLFQPR